jgi:hypothetical protein
MKNVNRTMVILFFASASVALAQTNTLPDTGNVGIGTTSPSNSLHVVGPTPGDANEGQLRIALSNGNFMLLGRASDYGFVQSHNREPLALNPLGNNIGVGTTSPSNSLHVVGPTPGDANEGQLRIALSNGNFVLLGRASDYGFLQSHNREPLALNPLGNNVGIGTTEPETELDVAGTTRTNILQITGGSDLAEPFEIEGAALVEPGMVVSIDPERIGGLRIATEAYDRTVAGIVSGANGLNPGLTMVQEGAAADGFHPVSLTGRVYCWVEASNGPIQPGDLLTTSDIPGHAMKVTDHAKAQGAIIGKAMSALEKGRGTVLVLTSLQ